MNEPNVKYGTSGHDTFSLRIREVRILNAEITAKSEEAAAATLKARYLNGEAVQSEKEIFDVVISNQRGVELEVLELPNSKPLPIRRNSQY